MTYNELRNGIYEGVGTYEKVFPLDSIKDASSSSISWSETGSVLVETKVTGGSWTTAVNGGSIADISGDLTDKYLAIRVTLTPTDLLTTPTFFNATAEVIQDEETIFYGVVGIPETPTYSTGYESDIYKIKLQSANALMRRRTLSEAYQDASLNSIVLDIYNKYIATEGIELGQISDMTFDYDIYVAQRKYVGDVLDELVAPVGATWHISADKKFYFLTKEDFTKVDAPSEITELKKSTSGLDMRTVQVIVGAKARTSTQTLSVTWAEDQKQIIASFPLAETPTIKINGVNATVGVNGLDSDNTDKTFLWTSESENINLNTDATTQPATGDTVTVEYIGLFEIEIENQNGSKILELAELTGTSGRIEKVETDTDINTYQDGSNLADELLDRYGEADETITCKVKSMANTDLLTVWTFDLPELNIEGDYIITGRSIQRLTEEKPLVTLTLKNKQYYLKYGSIFADYDKNILRLSVNASSVIIKTEASYNETLAFSEDYEQAGLVFYPTSGDFSDPATLIYPMEMQA